MIRPNISKLMAVKGNYIPGIAKYKLDMEDLDGEGSGRSETGVAHREVIRKKVKKLFVNCIQDDPEVLAVAELIQDDITEMTVFCPGDPAAEKYYSTSDYYVSKISIELTNLSYNSEGEGEGLWSVSFNAVEV